MKSLYRDGLLDGAIIGAILSFGVIYVLDHAFTPPDPNTQKIKRIADDRAGAIADDIIRCYMEGRSPTIVKNPYKVVCRP